MRYELLSVLGAVGLAGWYLRGRALAGDRRRVGALLRGHLRDLLTAHGRLLAEYATSVADRVEAGPDPRARRPRIRYAYADYWTAYYVTFMTRERIIVASDEVVKVRTYNRLVDAHRDEAIRISRRPCPGGEQLTSAFWSCKP